MNNKTRAKLKESNNSSLNSTNVGINKKLDDFYDLTSKKRARDQPDTSSLNDSQTNKCRLIKSIPIPIEDESCEEVQSLQEKQDKKAKGKKNRENCSICRTGGDLLLCDNCPKSFHPTCLKLQKIPEGEWFCFNCLPIIEKKSEKIKEIDEKKKIKNEKRRLWRLKKKAETLKNSNGVPTKDNISPSMKENVSLSANKTTTIISVVENGLSTNFPFVNTIPSELQRKLSNEAEKMDRTLTAKLSVNKNGNMLLDSFFKQKRNPQSNSVIDLTDGVEERKSSPEVIDMTVEDTITEDKIVKALSTINKNANSIEALNKLAATNPHLYSEVSARYWSNILSKKSNKATKFPIPDNELYESPEIYSIPPEYFNKPKGRVCGIPNKHITNVYKIWDFINTFRLSFGIIPTSTTFTPEELYSNLNFHDDKENPLVSQVHVSLLKVACKLLENVDYSALEPELMLIKLVVINSPNINETIKKTWPEILKQITNSKLFSFMLTDQIKEMCSRTFNSQSYNLVFSIEEKLALLNYLMNSVIDSEYIRGIIKDDLDKRNELRRTKRDFEEELRMAETRKLQLERQEKFTQPKQKVEEITRKLQTLNEDNPSLSRSELSKLRKEMEVEREQFKSVIKELEGNEDRRNDIMSKIEKISNEIFDIPSVTKKHIGTDGLGNEYFFYHNLPGKILIRTKNGEGRNATKKWRELTTDEEVKELMSKLSEKGEKENNLLIKLSKLYKGKRLKFTPPKEDKMTIEIEDEKESTNLQEEIAESLFKIESKLTDYLYQDEKEWESYDIREGLKAWVSYINNIPEYIKTLVLFNERIKAPYKINDVKRGMIIDDDDHEAYHFIINPENQQLEPYKVNPNRIFASKAKLWSRDFEALGMEDVFLEYLNTVATTSSLFVAIYVFDAVVNDLLKRRDYYKKKGDDLGYPTELPSNVKSNEKVTVVEPKGNNKKVASFEIDDYMFDDEDYEESRNKFNKRASKRIASIPSNTKNIPKKTVNHTGKNIDWNDDCAMCDEPGNLICCEDCPTVVHLECIGEKKEPEIWRCEECNTKFANRRMTRSSKIK